MSLSIGIVGLPNVGKSTLFNALTKAQNAQAANYPFCTIEPNKATVAVPDKRVDALTAKAKPKKTIYASVDFIDIAGLVRGASRGEGLGNQFLGNIRECAAIVHVVRCFEDENITHVDGTWVEGARITSQGVTGQAWSIGGVASASSGTLYWSDLALVSGSPSNDTMTAFSNDD